MSRTNELRLMARVAQMYHIEKQRQADIAKHLRMSQATVSRMLKRAQDEEIVRTTVVAVPGTFAALEDEMRKRFDLTEAIVVECSEERDGAIMAQDWRSGRAFPRSDPAIGRNHRRFELVGDHPQNGR